jgi:hypothetical protein
MLNAKRFRKEVGTKKEEDLSRGSSTIFRVVSYLNLMATAFLNIY